MAAGARGQLDGAIEEKVVDVVGERLTAPGQHAVVTAVVRFNNLVLPVVDQVEVVAGAAFHEVGAPGAIETVVAGKPGEVVGLVIADQERGGFIGTIDLNEEGPAGAAGGGDGKTVAEALSNVEGLHRRDAVVEAVGPCAVAADAEAAIATGDIGLDEGRVAAGVAVAGAEGAAGGEGAVFADGADQGAAEYGRVVGTGDVDGQGLAGADAAIGDSDGEVLAGAGLTGFDGVVVGSEAPGAAGSRDAEGVQ